jgi:putative FmdB family regulatory protein
MPIYQYDCTSCSRRVDVFVRSASSTAKPACPECGGKKLTRVMSRFARARTAGQRLDDIDLNQEMGRLGSGNVGDFARWAKRMGREYDGELGSEFSEMAEKAEAGEDPIERVDPGFTLKHRIEKRRSEISSSDDSSSGT